MFHPHHQRRARATEQENPSKKPQHLHQRALLTPIPEHLLKHEVVTPFTSKEMKKYCLQTPRSSCTGSTRFLGFDTAGNHSLGTRGKGLAFSFGVWLWLSLVETQILSMESSQTQPEGRASASFTQRRRSERHHLLLNRARWRRWDQAALLENNEASRLFCAKGMEIIFVHLSEVEKKLSQRQEAPRPS